MTEPAAVLSPDGLDELIATLIADGYTVIGPTVADGAIDLAQIRSAADLPAGWGADSAPGRYRLRPRDDHAVFGHSAGAQSWKRFLHPPRRKLWSADGDGFRAAADDPPRYAFIGVRACDLAAIGTLGTVLAGGSHRDPSFGRRRAGLFIVAVGCTEPGGVCFCASMGTGPRPGPGYDLALTERIDGHGHRFVAEVGSGAGQEVVERISHRPAGEEEVTAAHAAVDAAASRMGRQMPSLDIRELLADNLESATWDEVARRCLTCGNCTMVCPTCFCVSTEERTDAGGGHAERWQHWASCFELDFSHLHGGSVRSSGASRYRQWITHKLSTWHDQFGGSGCVGCGRCIAWCPVGIDITEEVARLARPRREDDEAADAGNNR